MMKIILASGSPRRKELLSSLGHPYEVLPSHADEIVYTSLSPEENVKHIAFDKAHEVFKLHQDDIVIGADTIVVLNNMIYGKPKDELDAFQMLKKLSGKTHQVITGICVLKEGIKHNYAETSNVTFRHLSEEEITQYIKTKEPMDKAGAYAIQGLAKEFIVSYDGELENIIGLPLLKLERILEELAV